MQLRLFPKRVEDDLAPIGDGVTRPRWVRADDGLSYVTKDEADGVSSVRASEYLWLSVARRVGLPAPLPEVIINRDQRPLVCTRKEDTAIASNLNQLHLLAGNVVQGSAQLSRIYAFDLFSANWDRHPQNYLVLQEPGGTQSVFAIDFSHVTVSPDLTAPGRDPLYARKTATRAFFPFIIQPYGVDKKSATEIIERLALLPAQDMNAILTEMPDAWLDEAQKFAVLAWWDSPVRQTRCDLVKQGIENGTLL